MNLTEDVHYILNTLNNSGFESFVVGGCVRDYLMGNTPKDFDITTSAKPDHIKNLFNKTIDTGIEHGTVTVVLNKKNYEVTTFRIDGEYTNNRSPVEVVFTTDIVKDLKRRDFNMNAIAYNKSSGFVDPFNGRIDIENKIISGVGDPLVRFTEDALRMFRAIRFSTQLDFTIDLPTYDAILQKNYLVNSLSVERIRDEFTKMLLSTHIYKLSFIIQTELFKHYLLSFHKYLETHLGEIINILNLSKKDLVIRYSILLYNMGVHDAKKFLTFLKFDNKTITEVCNLISAYLEPIPNSDTDVRFLIKKYGYYTINNLFYILNDLCNISMLKQIKHLNTCQNLNLPIFIKDLSINGNDLKSLGVKNGVDIGRILNLLIDDVIKNPNLNNYDSLSILVKQYN